MPTREVVFLFDEDFGKLGKYQNNRNEIITRLLNLILKVLVYVVKMTTMDRHSDLCFRVRNFDWLGGVIDPEILLDLFIVEYTRLSIIHFLNSFE